MTCNCLITQATFQGKEFQHLGNMLPCSHWVFRSWIPVETHSGQQGWGVIEGQTSRLLIPSSVLNKTLSSLSQTQCTTYNALAKGPDQMRTQHGVHPAWAWRRKITQTLFISITLRGYDPEDDANNPHLGRECDMGTFLNNAQQCLRRRAGAECPLEGRS